MPLKYKQRVGRERAKETEPMCHEHTVHRTDREGQTTSMPLARQAASHPLQHKSEGKEKENETENN